MIKVYDLILNLLGTWFYLNNVMIKRIFQKFLHHIKWKYWVIDLCLREKNCLKKRPWHVENKVIHVEIFHTFYLMTSRLNKFSIGKKLQSCNFGILMLCVTRCDVVLKYTMKWTLVNVLFGCFLVYPIMHFITRDPSQLIYAYIVMQVIDVTKTINEVPTITT
jgi:hypothetical protein